MANTKRFVTTSQRHGIIEVTVSKWKHFAAMVHDQFRNAPEYIYRGQRRPEWELEATLDRQLEKKGVPSNQATHERHLDNFRRSIIGRRGNNPPKLADNELWALGQHQGLWTPLLDWTRSPYAAAFFTYERAFTRDAPEHRAVFVLDTELVETKSADLKRAAQKKPGRAPTVEFLRPEQHENLRLISQGGLFTRAPDGQTIEDWLRTSFPEAFRPWVLMKVLLPERDREDALRDLNRMNISRASLFPDLSGASAYCNMALQIDQY